MHNTIHTRLAGAVICAGIAVAAGCGRSELPVNVQPNLVRAMEIRNGLVGEVQPDEAQAGVPQQEPTGFATLKGRIIISGTPPQPVALNVDKDIEVCMPGGESIFSEDVVFDPATKGLANVLVFAEGIPAEWAHPDAAPGKSGEVEFDQKRCVFLSHVLAMQSSQTLKILNSDPVGHNTNMSPRRNLPFNQSIPTSGYASYQPTAEESQPFDVRCSIHPWMKAWIIFRNDGYFAVTGKDGSFEIPNLPAGVPLTLRVWQEAADFVSSATVNGSAVEWPRGRITLTLQPDEVQEWEVEIAASVFQ